MCVDGGRSWEDRSPIEALDIAVDPTDPAWVLATVQGGVAASTDGGRSSTTATGPQLAYLSWGPDGTVDGLDLEDALLAATTTGVYRSDEGGLTFTDIT